MELNKSYHESLKTLVGTNSELKKALELFQEKGIPTKKQEDYKYTNMQKFVPQGFKIAGVSKADFSEMLEKLGDLPSNHRIVFGNGEYLENLSQLPEGIEISFNHESLIEEGFALDSFSAINLIGKQKSAKLTIKRAQKLPLISVVHLCGSEESETSLSRLNIVAEEISESSFAEIFYSPSESKSFSNTLTTLNLKKGAHLKHTKAPLLGENHSHVGKVQATLDRDANLTSLTFSVTGLLSRNNIEVLCLEEGSHASVNGLYTGRGSQHHDSFCHVHHKAAHTTSDQLFKGILDDESRGVFTGKIVIHRDAQQVDSSQLNKNLLLNQKAHVDTRPQIEVYADDVKCGHGATIGQINEEEVFYLESRGIPKEKAQKILCHAFAQEVIETCDQKDLSQWLSSKLFDSFEKYALEKLGQQQ